MTAIQAVFSATAAAVVVAIALVCVGVAILAGLGWALIDAGALVGPSAVGAAAALLHNGGTVG